MSSGDTLCTFFPADSEPPATNYPFSDFRNVRRPTLRFDTTTQKTTHFTFVMPSNYTNLTGTTIRLFCAMSTAISLTLGWDVAFERCSDGALDLDGDGFASAVTITAVTVPGTAGQGFWMSVDVPKASMDGVVAGDTFCLRLRRDVANDNAAGDAEFIAGEIKET